MMNDVPCIVLAGGLGTRLRSVVADLPKCLAPIGNRPFLEWQLRSLNQRGVTRFVLALGHGASQVLDVLKQPWARELSVESVIEPAALGTGGATRFAMESCGLSEALIINGDTFVAGSIASMLSPLDRGNAELMRIATVEVPDRTRFGGIAVDSANRVKTFIEKGQSGLGLINAGLYRVHRDAFDQESEKAFSMETSVMPRLSAHGSLQARQLSGPFIDIGIPEDYRLFDLEYRRFIGEE